MPAPDSPEYEAYNEWLHYAEGSAMLPLMLNLYVSRLKEAGAPLHPRIDSEMANHLGYVEGALDGKEFFIGNSLTRRGCPDEFRRRNGESIRQARAISESRGLAVANARASRIPALDREGWRVSVRQIDANRSYGKSDPRTPSLRGATRRSNLALWLKLDCFASLAMTS